MFLVQRCAGGELEPPGGENAKIDVELEDEIIGGRVDCED